MKENIKEIFEKIQKMNSEFIYEIIEEFVDSDKLYQTLIDFILVCYYHKINEIFFSSSSAKKEKKSNLIEKALKDLSEGIKIADTCIGLMEKYKNLNINNSLKLNLKELQNIKLKIQLREAIIKGNNKSFLKKLFSSNDKLNNLFNQYYTCESHDKDDLQELKVLAGKKEAIKNDDKIIENFEEEFQNVSTFNEWITKKMTNLNYGEISNIITRILTEYPYCSKKNEQKMWDDFDLYKSKQMKFNRYILMIRGKYQTLLTDDKINDIKKQAYEKILLFLNSIDEKIFE